MGADDWTDEENDLLVAEYFEMLKLGLQGQSFNKAARQRELARSIPRSVKAIGRKQQNVSAILEDRNQLWITGLSPAEHYQKSLKDAVQRHLDARQQEDLQQVPEERMELDEGPEEYIAPPPSQASTIELTKPRNVVRRAQKLDYAERDASNRELGKLGEAYVVQLEQQRLKKAGRTDLAEQVIWASEEEGDGLGYDIRSYEIDGTERLIEVKTTNGGRETPFYISENELSFSEDEPERFVLVRVYNFSEEPACFELRSPLEQNLSLKPAVYKAVPE
ncbi:MULTISPECIES: DUF3883 domain-containing protein [unclassified Pseudovibrio]|uniref:DUF3883 domain-containing protein n=1 Tax=unclassified Pseudovibrio TaxID=2627060 RepID=UPI0007AE9092|nr:MULTISPECIES: DUF3883 domain-containing protein [unclassified Pseudovibrio]KZL03361.1 hypothetical protein PsW74_00787 [Pseudovibrio sp. W74]KZL12185.1 hypothetical protein PsAD14_00352 [Pseudovibrio sp. Ad14]